MTFVVNVAGAFLVGFFTTRLQERLPVSAYRRPLLGTGLCGGLTTDCIGNDSTFLSSFPYLGSPN